jgi:DMSO reductase anchor subunit
MIKGIWSLVFFTLLIQMSAGALLMYTILHWIQSPAPGNTIDIKISITVTLLVVVGMFFSFLHLGNPQHAVFAARNLGHSWLSREIITLLTFLLLAAMTTLSILLNKAWIPGPMVFITITAIVGTVLVYFMSRIYMITTVPVWNQALTPLSFFSSAVLLGATLLMVLLVYPDNVPYETSKMLTVLQLFVTVVLILELTVLFISGSFEFSFLYWSRIFLIAVAIAIVAWMYFRKEGQFTDNRTWILAALLLIILLIQETIGRFVFFGAYSRMGV